MRQSAVLSSNTQYAMRRETGGKWGTKGFALPTLQCVKLKKKQKKNTVYLYKITFKRGYISEK